MLWFLLVPFGALIVLYAAVVFEAHFHPHKPSRQRIFGKRQQPPPSRKRIFGTSPSPPPPPPRSALDLSDEEILAIRREVKAWTYGPQADSESMNTRDWRQSGSSE